MFSSKEFNILICQIFPYSFEITFIYFLFLKYLFIWLCHVLVAAHGIFSCGMWDLVPWPGIEPWAPALGAWSLSHWTTRDVPEITFKRIFFLNVSSLNIYCILFIPTFFQPSLNPEYEREPNQNKSLAAGVWGK